MTALPTDFHTARYGLDVRLVDESDAEFIVGLRTDPKLSRFINPTEGGVAAQREWIRGYKKREAEGTDYYFMFEKEGHRLGVCRIYDIESDTFAIGSWIFSPDAPMGASILADIITREIAFGLFPDKRLRFDVRQGNTNVLRYQHTYKPTLLQEDAQDCYFELSAENFEKYKKLHLRMFAPKP